MSDERLAEIAACSAAADRGPWDVIAGEVAVYIDSPSGEVLFHYERGYEEYVWISDANAALIANAQTYITELLAEVARLREAPTITDEMVERAGKALNARGWTYMGVHEPPCWCEDCKRVCTEDARRILKAALGGGES